MSSYTVATGDTFELIARKQYGDETQAIRISSANPGTSEPLVAGTLLNIPEQPAAPKNAKQQTVGGENEVAVLIDGQRFKFWEQIRITRAIDAMDTVEFSAPFQPDQQSFRDTFKPFTYKRAEITVAGEQLFTGTLVGISPSLGANRRTVDASAYSLPGVLNDCTLPASTYETQGVETDQQGLREVAEAAAKAFGLGVVFADDPGATFERVAAGTSERVLSYLAKLAQQRNLIISSTPAGELLFQRSVAAGNPVAVLQQGESPVLSVTPFFSEQEYYSHVTGVDPVLVGTEGSQFTVKNARLQGVIRPITFSVTDATGGGVKDAVEAKAGRMFANMVSYEVELATWRDPQGELWVPNTTLKLQAAGAMIYTSYEFLIRSVSLSRSSTGETATLNLVLPGSFSGQIPETLPWDE